MLYIENISSKKNAYDVQWNNKSERHYGYDIGTGFVKKKKHSKHALSNFMNIRRPASNSQEDEWLSNLFTKYFNELVENLRKHVQTCQYLTKMCKKERKNLEN